MRVIIDPAWSLRRAIEAAFDAYTGSGKSSRGYRMSVVMTWANVVGRARAVNELNDLKQEAGGWGQLAEAFGISISTLRKARRHFEKVPDHFASMGNSTDDMTTLNDFRLLGRGGFGEVWRANDALGRVVAVKFMTTASSETQRAVLAHAQPLAALGQHPNIVFVYYCNYLPHPTTQERVPALVMEFIDGQTLGERMATALDRELATAISSSLANAIVHVHSKGLVHGDLHQDNVMLTKDGGVKVIDLLNDRTLSEFTSGARKHGQTDDVEALKALIGDLLRAASCSSEVARFEAAVAGLKDASGVRAALHDAMGTGDEAPSLLPAFLLTWTQIERDLRILSGNPSEGRSVPLVRMIEKANLDHKTKAELIELTKVRNRAVHEGAPVDGSVLNRVATVREILDQTVTN